MALRGKPRSVVCSGRKKDRGLLRSRGLGQLETAPQEPQETPDHREAGSWHRPPDEDILPRFFMLPTSPQQLDFLCSADEGEEEQGHMFRRRRRR